MKRFGVVLGVAMLCVPMLVVSLSARRAADVTGKWDVAAKMTMKGGGAGPEGMSMDLKAVLDLKAKDDQLTGTFTPYEGDTAKTPLQITNGKVDGDKITFDVKDSDVMKFSLTLDGDHLKGEAVPEKAPEDGTKVVITIDATRSK